MANLDEIISGEQRIGTSHNYKQILRDYPDWNDRKQVLENIIENEKLTPMDLVSMLYDCRIRMSFLSEHEHLFMQVKNVITDDYINSVTSSNSRFTSDIINKLGNLIDFQKVASEAPFDETKIIEDFYPKLSPYIEDVLSNPNIQENALAKFIELTCEVQDDSKLKENFKQIYPKLTISRRNVVKMCMEENNKGNILPRMKKEYDYQQSDMQKWSLAR